MATKKAPTKKKPSAKKKATAPKAPLYQTLKVTKKDVPFFGTSLTRQTFYWTIISFLVLIMGLWIINLQYDISNLYDRLDAQQTEWTPVPPKK